MEVPPPPPGLDIYANKQPDLYAATFITWALGIAAVSLRFYCRHVSKAKFWWDDWLMLGGLTVSTAQCFLSYGFMFRAGAGRHIWAVRPGPDNFTNLFIGLFALQITYTFEIVLVKLSILAFYWRIFSVSSIRRPIYALVVIIMLWFIGTIAATFLQCTPVDQFWKHTSETACASFDTKKFYLGNIIPNILIDVLLLALPVPYVLKLQVTKARKVAILGLFLLGGFIVGVSIVRCVFFMQSDPTNPDIFWNVTNLDIWSIVELNIALVSGCLPSLGPIFHGKLKDNWFGSRAWSWIASSFSSVTGSKKSTTDGSGLQLTPKGATQLSDIRHVSDDRRPFVKLGDSTLSSNDGEYEAKESWNDTRNVRVKDDVQVTWSHAHDV